MRGFFRLHEERHRAPRSGRGPRWPIILWVVACLGAIGGVNVLVGCDQPLEPALSKLERYEPPASKLQSYAPPPSKLAAYAPGCEPIDMPNLPHLEPYHCAVRDAVTRYAHGKIAPENILAEIEVESDGRMDAVSSAGARCAMQLLPSTFASMLPRGDIEDVGDCIRAGVKYRAWCARWWTAGLRPEEERWGPLSEACYNAGPGNMLAAQGRCGGYLFSDFRECAPTETQNYVVRIAGLEAGKPRGWWRE